MLQTTQLIQTSNGRTILDIALQKGSVKVLQYLVREKKIAFTSQNSGQDQDAVWKALGLILRSKSDDDDDDGKHGDPGLENENSSRNMEMKVKLPTNEKYSEDSMVPFREIGNSCHENSFNMSLAMNDKMNNVGSQIFDLIGDFDDDYDDEDESSTGSEGTYPAKQNNKKKTAVWMRRMNEKTADKKDGRKDSRKDRGKRRKSKSKTIDLKETQRLSKLKLEQYNLRSESTLDTKGSESDTDLLMCNFSCPMFQESCDSFWD